MSIKMKELQKNRREWVEVTRKNGFREGIFDLLAHQYSNKTHFIFELLQNAEDAGATEVNFKVEAEQLVFSHNGLRLFSSGDVESITSIGRSTKHRDDYTQIGKHGIGFKSVFAYTHSPRIYSGDKRFEIEDVVAPRILGDSEIPHDLKPEVTRICIPFDNENIPSEKRFRELVSSESAYQEISDTLRNINIRTLLFLRNITTIHWVFANGEEGSCVRETNLFSKGHEARRVDLIDSNNQMESWVVFEQETEVSDDGRKYSCTVEVAFLLEKEKVIRASNTELVVFFPTEKKTELGFLIQGPFKTTKARDNIAENDEANRELLESIAKLAADSLEKLRDLKLLDINSYGAFPLKSSLFLDDKTKYFEPVYWKIREAFKSKRLLPQKTGEFIYASQAKLARGKGLIELFLPEQLSELFGCNGLNWLDVSITESGDFSDFHTYLVGKKKYYSQDWEEEPLWAGMEQDAERLIPKLTASFFENQPLKWLVEFYDYVLKNPSQKRLLWTKKTPCIPLQSGKWAFRAEENVVFPRTENENDITGIKFLNVDVLRAAGEKEEDVRTFLKEMGVHDLGKEDEVRSLLSSYYDPEVPVELPLREHLGHIRTFIAYWKDEPMKAKSLLESKSIFCADTEYWSKQKYDIVHTFYTAAQCFIDQPLKNTMLYDVLNSDSDNPKKVLSHIYETLGVELFDFSEEIGVQSNLSPIRCDATENPRIKVDKSRTWYRSEEDWDLPNSIQKIFTHQSGGLDEKVTASALIWNMMSSLDTSCFTVKYKQNSHMGEGKAPSMLMQRLSELKWLPNKDADWVQPCDLTEETLDTGEQDDETAILNIVKAKANGWLYEVGFGASKEIEQLLEKTGISPEVLERAKAIQKTEFGIPEIDRPYILSEPPIQEVNIAEMLSNSFNKKGIVNVSEKYRTHGDSLVGNPPRVSSKIKEMIDRLNSGEGMRKDPQTRQSLLEWYGGRCQICEKTWSKHDGEPFFVAAYIIELQDCWWLDFPGNALCLCPKHFIQWKHSVKKTDYDLGEWISNQKLKNEGGSGEPIEIKFELLEKPVFITYTERHFIELRTLVKIDRERSGFGCEDVDDGER